MIQLQSSCTLVLRPQLYEHMASENTPLSKCPIDEHWQIAIIGLADEEAALSIMYAIMMFLCGHVVTVRPRGA